MNFILDNYFKKQRHKRHSFKWVYRKNKFKMWIFWWEIYKIRMPPVQNLIHSCLFCVFRCRTCCLLLCCISLRVRITTTPHNCRWGPPATKTSRTYAASATARGCPTPPSSLLVIARDRSAMYTTRACRSGLWVLTLRAARFADSNSSCTLRTSLSGRY